MFSIRIVICVLAAVLIQSCNNPNIAVVDQGKVFESFSYKKELESTLIKSKNDRQNILDSLKLMSKYKMDSILQKVDRMAANSFLERESRKMQLLESRYYNEIQAITEDFDSRIQKQLATYINDFAKKNKIDLLLDCRKGSNTLYADSTLDMTKEAIQFVNKSYDGQTK